MDIMVNQPFQCRSKHSIKRQSLQILNQILEYKQIACFSQQSDMNIQVEKQLNFGPAYQGYMIPTSCYLYPHTQPLFWAPIPIRINQEDFHFSISQNQQMIFQPLQQHFRIDNQQDMIYDCPKSLNQNDQKTEGSEDKKENLKSSRIRILRTSTSSENNTAIHKKVIKKNEGNCQQNPQRNIVTNIGNQLLTFATNKSKCLKAMQLAFGTINENEWAGFFKYVKRLKSRIGYYLNYAKMKDIWYSNQFSSSCKDHQKMLRTVSYFYLSQIIRVVVLNSTKMQKDSKGYHMKAIRKLMRDLRHPPKSY